MSHHPCDDAARADDLLRSSGITFDDRFLLRVEAPLSPMWVGALGKAIKALAEKHPSLTPPERLARVISAGCIAVLDDAHRTHQRGKATP